MSFDLWWFIALYSTFSGVLATIVAWGISRLFPAPKANLGHVALATLLAISLAGFLPPRSISMMQRMGIEFLVAIVILFLAPRLLGLRTIRDDHRSFEKFPSFDKGFDDRSPPGTDLVQSKSHSSNVLENARLALEYRKDAKSAYDSIANLPMSYRELFLRELDQNPKADVNEILSDIQKRYDKDLNPFVSERANEYYRKLAEINVEASKEFLNVGNALGDKFDIDYTFGVVCKKYRVLDGMDVVYNLNDPHSLAQLLGTILHKHKLSGDDRQELSQIRNKLLMVGELDDSRIAYVRKIAVDLGFIT